MPASLSAATICSDSACLTRGSLAPWAISSGIRMSRARDSRDRDHRKTRSVSGLPTRLYSWAIIGVRRAGVAPGAAKLVGGKRRPDRPLVPAVGAAVDGHMVPVGPALADDVV